ncbi:MULTISPECIES: putative quinol monooxygenase [Paenibacillus]|uniref:Antibiotic biosynthesis monooxygenase n=1 Tax=Paenibacillus agri TaxID=2744309 RepID=A0A850EM09_9BACL|nr:putative quinol monooxygenase [Paenibacillus agri]NUU62098.1 antibiotic biosynthesis monooxygenase [Paenibacillus agri]
MNKFTMFGKMTAHPGKREELTSLLLEASRSLNNMESCELYIINESVDDPDVIWVTELWRDAEAHADSLKNEEVLAVIQRAKPLIAAVEPVRLRPVGGKGLGV